ncbi:MAG: hypothetical protein WBN97_12290 [Parvibaculum sp.]
MREVANEIKSQDGAHPLLLLPPDQATLDNISARRQHFQIDSRFSEDHCRAVILALQGRGIRRIACRITYEAALPSMRKPEQIGHFDIEALPADAQRLEASQLQR